MRRADSPVHHCGTRLRVLTLQHRLQQPNFLLRSPARSAPSERGLLEMKLSEGEAGNGGGVDHEKLLLQARRGDASTPNCTSSTTT
jgi:hypothetical protein